MELPELCASRRLKLPCIAIAGATLLIRRSACRLVYFISLLLISVEQNLQTDFWGCADDFDLSRLLYR
jgi:hypothetical protein